MRHFTRALVTTVLLGFGAGQAAHAELAMNGLPHPVNKFPLWVKDSKNVTLQLCLDGSGTATGVPGDYCFFDPVEEGNAFSEQIGFGPEAFWWMADAEVAMTGGSAQLVLALEAAWGAEVPQDGQQFAFGRVRIRIDAPVAGTYKVWHPYACEPEIYQVTTPGRRAINVTRDIGGGAPFADMLAGEVGPFLVWDETFPPPPAGYVGDGATPHGVTGSPCGPDGNVFRVEGPAGANLGGPAGSENVVETWEFTVMGKIFDSATTPFPLVVDGATFYRNQAGTSARLNVWAQSDPMALLKRSGQPGAAQTMDGDGEGHFFNRRAYSNSNTTNLEPTVKVKTENSPVKQIEVTASLTDSVKITSVTYAPAKHELKVVATTSDEYQPASPTGDANPDPKKRLNQLARSLTVRAGSRSEVMTPDPVTAGKFSFIFTNMYAPPAKVVVTSDLQGRDEEVVTP